ncbi:MAG: hypothetical protein JWO52_3331 [Gammaproteobacteria bacterium]|nr:hypothetical protein [Gammaproteobacteria bacterium]
MDVLELPARGRPAWLAKQLKISVTGAQKYLNGTAMPKGSRYGELATLLHVNVAWLRDDQGPMKKTAMEGSNALLDRLHAAWRALPNDTVRLEILHYVEHRASLGEIQVRHPKEAKTHAGR